MTEENPTPKGGLPKIELRSYDGKLDEVVASAPGGVWVHLEDMGGSWFLMVKVGDSEVFLNIQSEEAVVTDTVGEVAKLDRPSGDEPVSVPYTLAESAAEAADFSYELTNEALRLMRARPKHKETTVGNERPSSTREPGRSGARSVRSSRGQSTARGAETDHGWTSWDTTLHADAWCTVGSWISRGRSSLSRMG